MPNTDGRSAAMAIECHPQYGLLTLASMAAGYRLSSLVVRCRHAQHGSVVGEQSDER